MFVCAHTRTKEVSETIAGTAEVEKIKIQLYDWQVFVLYRTIKPFPYRKKNTGTTIKLFAARSNTDDGNENMIIENMNNEAEEVNNGDVIMGSLSVETPLPSPRATIQVTPQVITPKTTDPSRIPQDTDNEEDSDDKEVMEALRKSADTLPFRAGKGQGDEDVDDDKSNDDGGDDVDKATQLSYFSTCFSSCAWGSCVLGLFSQ